MKRTRIAAEVGALLGNRPMPRCVVYGPPFKGWALHHSHLPNYFTDWPLLWRNDAIRSLRHRPARH